MLDPTQAGLGHHRNLYFKDWCIKIENSKQNLAQMGSFFRQHRLERKLDSETVAKELGLPSAADLQAVEDGEQAISLEDIFVLTNLYNISPDEVVRLLYELSLGLTADNARELKLKSGS